MTKMMNMLVTNIVSQLGDPTHSMSLINGRSVQRLRVIAGIIGTPFSDSIQSAP